MVPYHGWMDEPKKALENVSWYPISFLKKIGYFIRYRTWLTRSTQWYSLDIYNISDYKTLIESLQIDGMVFRIRYSPDVDYQYAMFLAGTDEDLTVMRIMK